MALLGQPAVLVFFWGPLNHERGESSNTYIVIRCLWVTDQKPQLPSLRKDIMQHAREATNLGRGFPLEPGWAGLLCSMNRRHSDHYVQSNLAVWREEDEWKVGIQHVKWPRTTRHSELLKDRHYEASCIRSTSLLCDRSIREIGN